MPRISTLAHELGHALEHAPHAIELRRRGVVLGRTVGLQRVQRKTLHAYEDVEWQAWAIGSAIVAPVSAIRRLPRADLSEMARVFNVTNSMLANHLRRLERGRQISLGPHVFRTVVVRTGGPR